MAISATSKTDPVSVAVGAINRCGAHPLAVVRAIVHLHAALADLPSEDRLGRYEMPEEVDIISDLEPNERVVAAALWAALSSLLAGEVALLLAQLSDWPPLDRAADYFDAPNVVAFLGAPVAAPEAGARRPTKSRGDRSRTTRTTGDVFGPSDPSTSAPPSAV